MTRIALVDIALVALCGAVAPAQTGWKNLTGQHAPELEVRRWLNTERHVTNDSLKGKVWLLEFFATW